VHFAAESHVLRSLAEPSRFLQTNVTGTDTLLNKVRVFMEMFPDTLKKFIHISTDEVYGSLDHTQEHWTEIDGLFPTNPYSVSKAAADMVAQSYERTFGVPVVVLRLSNTYGPRQYHEKLIPMCIKQALAEDALLVHGDGEQLRDWLWWWDACEAVMAAIERGRPGHIYNIGGDNERSVNEVVGSIAKLMGHEHIEHIDDRPGNDRRYKMNLHKAELILEWKPRVRFEEGIQKTVAWFMQNKDHLK